MSQYASSVLASLAVLLVAGAAHAAVGARPSGAYAVVDHRTASGVAATTASYDPAARQRELGQVVRYDETIVWYDGRFCGDWAVAAGPAPDVIATDPNLADLEIAGSGTLVNQPLSLTCDGAPFAEVILIDERVQIAFVPNGTMYVVLERLPSVDEAIEVQQALAGLGLYRGEIDGHFGETTRAALAAFIASRGVHAPQVGVLSEAIYRALVAG